MRAGHGELRAHEQQQHEQPRVRSQRREQRAHQELRGQPWVQHLAQFLHPPPPGNIIYYNNRLRGVSFQPFFGS